MSRRLAWMAAAALVALGAPPSRAHGQLRPLEPLPWAALEEGQWLWLQAGVGAHRGQRAALAGTEGSLVELGNLHAVWRAGRTAVEVQGTVRRAFRDRERFAAPAPGVAAADPHRADTGDFAVATIVHLTPEAPAAVALRFGTRLPNSDNREGLDRDRTDFFALLAGRAGRGALRATAEAGVGIHGTHSERYEQADVLLYAAGVEARLRHLTPTASLTGHYAPHLPARGNESLAELRLGVRVGRRHWVHAAWVRGLTLHSPAGGALLSAGIAR